MGDSKKAVVAGMASILLVAAVVAVAIGSSKGGDTKPNTGSNKAVQALCAPTGYKETCEKSLSQANSSDPKELIKVVFDATIKNIGDVLKDSSLLKEVEADQSTKDSYRVCKEVLETAVDDLRRSIEEVGASEMENLRKWLSAVVTNEETCIDAFNETSTEAGEKMRKLLATAKQLTSNGLAMVTDLSSLFGSFSSRKLLATEEPDFARKRLQEVTKMSLKPSIVVAKDGSGNFTKIGDAIATLPMNSNETIVIHVKEGVYEEYVNIPKNLNNVMMVGDGPLKTRVTGNKSFAGGVKTFYTATFGVSGEDFFAMDMGFENTAGPLGHQAVALRVSNDRAVLYNVHIDGYQDTLYAQSYFQYYRDCTISGTIDFVFGDALAIFQNCTFIVRKPEKNQGCMVTAQGRSDPKSTSAIVIQNGNITAENALLTAQPPVKAYLGRPWKELSRTIIMQSNIDEFIDPTGWAPWMGNFALDTLYYAEFENRGNGSDITNRVQWKGIQKFTPEMAESWTGGKAYAQASPGDEWIKRTGVPYVPTMMQV